MTFMRAIAGKRRFALQQVDRNFTSRGMIGQRRLENGFPGEAIVHKAVRDRRLSFLHSFALRARSRKVIDLSTGSCWIQADTDTNLAAAEPGPAAATGNAKKLQGAVGLTLPLRCGGWAAVKPCTEAGEIVYPVTESLRKWT
jgi:hypothetical protein